MPMTPEQLEDALDRALREIDSLKYQIAEVQVEIGSKDRLVDKLKMGLAQARSDLLQLANVPRFVKASSQLGVQKTVDGGVILHNWDRVFHRFRPYSDLSGDNKIYMTGGSIWYKGTEFVMEGVDPLDPTDRKELTIPYPEFSDSDYLYAIAVLDPSDTGHTFDVELRTSLADFDVEFERLLFTAALTGAGSGTTIGAFEFYRHQLSDIVITEDSTPHTFDYSINDDGSLSVSKGWVWYNNQWLEVDADPSIGSTSENWICVEIGPYADPAEGTLVARSAMPGEAEIPFTIPVMEIVYDGAEVDYVNRHLVGNDNGVFWLAEDSDYPLDNGPAALVGTSPKAARADHVHAGGDEVVNRWYNFEETAWWDGDTEPTVAGAAGFELHSGAFWFTIGQSIPTGLRLHHYQHCVPIGPST